MTKGDLRKLKAVRKHLEMENCSFDRIGEDNVFISHGQVTAFIKERTRNWLQSWIFYPLDELIEKYEKQHARKVQPRV
jgi:hypothetical protein